MEEYTMSQNDKDAIRPPRVPQGNRRHRRRRRRRARCCRPRRPSAQQAKLKVGLMLPYTGTFAQLGVAITNGFKLAVDERGGKLGRARDRVRHRR
jgi:ABC-type branched-subunit amino acid transport system substrate-binding protein